MGVKTFNYWNFRFVNNQLNKDTLNRRHTHTNDSNYERASCDLGLKRRALPIGTTHNFEPSTKHQN